MSNLKGLEPSKDAYVVLKKFPVDWASLSLDYVNTGFQFDQPSVQLFFLGGSYTDGSCKP